MIKMMENIENDVLTLSLEGSLDENTSPQVETKIDEIFDADASTIRLDMRDVKYISSIGIRLIILTYKKAIKMEKKVVLGDMSDKVKDILETVGVLPLFSAQGNQ